MSDPHLARAFARDFLCDQYLLVHVTCSKPTMSNVFQLRMVFLTNLTFIIRTPSAYAEKATADNAIACTLRHGSGWHAGLNCVISPI